MDKGVSTRFTLVCKQTISLVLLVSSNHASCGLLCVCLCLRKATKESLVETSSNITESLMSISRLMAEQVKQSEDTISTLGKENYYYYYYYLVYSVFVHFSSSSLLNL